MNRRRLLLAVMTAWSLDRHRRPALGAQSPSDTFDVLFRSLQASPDAVRAAREFSDYAEADAPASCRDVILDGQRTCIVSAARRPGRLRPSAAKVSGKASDLIVFCEVTSKARFEESLDHPVWPRLQSGVTIGIGYDLGYVDRDDFVREWSAYLHPYTVGALSKVVGKRGQDAQQALADVEHLKISWAEAYRQFAEMLLPIFVAETERFCENTGMLSADSRGALVSLVINRGSSLRLENDALDRRREMREIASLMKTKEFSRVPAKLLEMTRLWQDNPDARGLVIRRRAEAALFEAGLAQGGSVTGN